MATVEVVAVQTALPSEEKVEETNKDKEIQVSAPEPESDFQENPNPSKDDPAETKEESIKDHETITSDDQTKDDNAAADDSEDIKAGLEKLELETKTDGSPLPEQEASSKVAPEPQTEVANDDDKEVQVVEFEPENEVAGAAPDSAKTDDSPVLEQEASSKVAPEPQTKVAKDDKEVQVVESESENEVAGAAPNSAESSKVAPEPQTEVAKDDKEVQVVESEPEPESEKEAAPDSGETVGENEKVVIGNNDAEA